jgi:putative endonuclease
MQNQTGWTYMLASGRAGKLYTGATPDLMRRVFMHKRGIASHFTRKYAVTDLVWYEQHAHLQEAFLRCEQIRHARRRWKMQLIDNANPEWIDLYRIMELLPGVPPPVLLWPSSLKVSQSHGF